MDWIVVLEDQLIKTWQRVTDKFTAKGKPVVRTVSEGQMDLQKSWSRCVSSIQVLFATHYGQNAIDARFQVPEDYSIFMRIIGGGWKWPYGLEWELFDADSVAAVTAHDFRLFVTEAEDDPVLDSGFWLGIGWWSDKHEYLLCCDRAHDYYGVVLDGHDSHPWGNGVEYGGCRRMAESFVDWLQKI